MKKSKQGNDKLTMSALEDSPSHLLHRVLQIALDIYNGETGEGALTQRQFAVLKALDEATQAGNGASVTQTDLVQSTGIDRSTLADMVTRMTTKGLLVREKSASDGRANLVSLSDAGRAALSDIAPKVAAADAAILNLLSPPKRDSFVKLLRKVAQARAEMSAAESDAAPKSEKAGKKPRAAKPDKKADKKKKIKKPEKPAKKQKNQAAAPVAEAAPAAAEKTEA